MLREFRGDGHVAALTVEGVRGVDALLIHAATGDVPAGVLQATRAWPDDEWRAAADALRSRGWLTGDAGLTLTDAGRRHRDWVEARTDELALAAYEPLGDDGCRRLRELGRIMSAAIVASGLLSFDPSDLDG